MTTEELAEAKAEAITKITRVIHEAMSEYKAKTGGRIIDVSPYIASYEHRSGDKSFVQGFVDRVSRLESVEITTTFSHNKDI